MGYMTRRNTYYSDYCNKPSCVYRLFDIGGNLLYVGMTTNPASRLPSHKRKAWGHLIASHTEEWHPNRRDALAAERSAIHHENPTHNLVRPHLECC